MLLIKNLLDFSDHPLMPPSARWNIELGFRNLKSSLLDNARVLRSRKVKR